MKSPTVSQELFRLLKENGVWMASGALEETSVLGATGSTISRKLRALCEAGYVEVKYEGEKHHAFYRARTKKSEVVYVPTEAPKQPQGKSKSEEPIKPRFRYEIVEKNGMRVAMEVPV